MKTRWKILVVLGALVAAGYVGYQLVAMDASPPQDADLAPTWEDVPPGENAFECFLEAANLLHWPEEDEESPPGQGGGPSADAADAATAGDGAPAGTPMAPILAGDAWDEPRVREVLAANEAALKAWEAGLARKGFQVPPPATIEDFAAVYDLRWVNLAKVALLRAHLLAHEDRTEEAMTEAMKVVRFGHLIEGAKGSMSTYAAGATVKDCGLTVLTYVACNGVPEATVLKECGRQLAGYGADTQGLAETFRVEYACGSEFLKGFRPDEVLRGLPTLADPSNFDAYSLGREVKLACDDIRENQLSLPTRYYYQPNRSRAILGKAFRAWIAAVPMRYVDIERRVPVPEGAKRRLIWPNCAGIALCRFLAPSDIARRTLRLKCGENDAVARARTILALRRYVIERDAAPESWEALVPEYLEALPVSDVDGRPLRLPTLGHSPETGG